MDKNPPRYVKKRPYSRADIELIIAHLLADDPEISNWHSPKGVLPKKTMGITVKVQEDEYWVIKHLAEKNRLSMAEMLKSLVLGHFVKHEPEIVLPMTKDVGSKVMLKLFGIAARKTKKKIRRLEKKKTKSNVQLQNNSNKPREHQ